MNPLRIAILVAAAFALLVIAALVAFLVGTGLAIARWWIRRTRGDVPTEPAAREPGDYCPRCGRHYGTYEGARLCYELCCELEGATTR